MTPDAIRRRAATLLEAGLEGALEHFAVHPDRLDAVTDYVLGVIRENYPALDIPYHSRWRHFVIGSRDLWIEIAQGLSGAERARTAFDLAVTSVLLDAGAGDAWRYRDQRTGAELARSEGLAIASLNAFADGVFSNDPATPMRADANALTTLSVDAIAEAFQVSDDNLLEGLEGRTNLLKALGAALIARPEIFDADQPRVGGMFDYLSAQATSGTLEAPTVLGAVLEGLGSIWPGRIELDGRNLGDTWHHPAARTDDPSNGLVPFHKLSQWLTYSLVEPLEDAGITVTGLDGLTALAEYRNGGLLVDLGVLEPKHDRVTGEPHAPGDTVIVEWRSLTIALIPQIADRIRLRLDLSADELPLAKVLQGGTWAAGRKTAQEIRHGGGPPIRIISDGSVF